MDQRDDIVFLRNKVEAARRSVRAGCGASNEDVEADFAVRRAKTASHRDSSPHAASPSRASRGGEASLAWRSFFEVPAID